MIEYFGLYVALLLGFGSLFSMQMQLNDKLNAINMQFAQCPAHQKRMRGGDDVSQ